MTRLAKHVIYHPKYRGKIGNTARDMPIYDFALIEVDVPMYPFHKKMQPICLPPEMFWYKIWPPEKFVGYWASGMGYGRVESEKIKGKDQTACQALKADLRVIDSKDPRCSIVISSPSLPHLLLL